MSGFSSLMRAERTDNYPVYLLRTIMMSPGDTSLEDLLYGSDLGDEADAVELGGGQARVEESAAADNVSMKTVSNAFLILVQGHLYLSYNSML